MILPAFILCLGVTAQIRLLVILSRASFAERRISRRVLKKPPLSPPRRGVVPNASAEKILIKLGVLCASAVRNRTFSAVS
jgi:hypothetical protein